MVAAFDPIWPPKGAKEAVTGCLRRMEVGRMSKGQQMITGMRITTKGVHSDIGVGHEHERSFLSTVVTRSEG